MKITKITLKNYRNIDFAEIYPFDTMNVICGENAQGKTNLIEAIWLFSGAKSFRNTKESSPIKFNEENAKIEIEFISLGVENKAKIEFGEKKQAFFNDKPLSAPSKLAGLFNAIVFSPTDLGLVKDGPCVRRRFLDIAIGQLYPSYISVLGDYMRAVKQRNQIIKDLKFDATLNSLIDVFEEEIVEKGKKIIDYRKKYIDTIKEFLPPIYEGLSGGREKLEIKLLLSTEGDEFSEKLKKSRKEDSFTGNTSVGPHRDDIVFYLNSVNARVYGSQGQQRSIALSLKLAGAQVIKNISGEYPVCLLDDVMSELDPNRQGYILNHIREWQSFISCCDPSNIKNLEQVKIFLIKKGEIMT